MVLSPNRDVNNYGTDPAGPALFGVLTTMAPRFEYRGFRHPFLMVSAYGFVMLLYYANDFFRERISQAASEICPGQ